MHLQLLAATDTALWLFDDGSDYLNWYRVLVRIDIPSDLA
jgi:hypothetical protein